MGLLRWAGQAFATWTVCMVSGSANAADLDITFGEVEAIVQRHAAQASIEERVWQGRLYFHIG
jgi:hypothetical protein